MRIVGHLIEVTEKPHDDEGLSEASCMSSLVVQVELRDSKLSLYKDIQSDKLFQELTSIPLDKVPRIISNCFSPAKK